MHWAQVDVRPSASHIHHPGGKELRRSVWPRYKELEFQSRQARYQCVSFDRDFVQSRLLVFLDEIEQEMQSLT